MRLNLLHVFLFCVLIVVTENIIVKQLDLGHVVPGVVVCLLWCIMVGRVNARRY